MNLAEVSAWVEALPSDPLAFGAMSDAELRFWDAASRKVECFGERVRFELRFRGQAIPASQRKQRAMAKRHKLQAAKHG